MRKIQVKIFKPKVLISFQANFFVVFAIHLWIINKYSSDSGVNEDHHYGPINYDLHDRWINDKIYEKPPKYKLFCLLCLTVVFTFWFLKKNYEPDFFL